MFRITDDIVTGISHRASAKTGKTRKLRRLILIKNPFQFLQRVRDGTFFCLSLPLDNHPLLVGIDG